MPRGTVKWFDAKKGYGFIDMGDDDEDIFVHHTQIQMDGFRSLAEGDLVEFELVQGKDGRPQAAKVVRVGGGAELQGRS